VVRAHSQLVQHAQCADCAEGIPDVDAAVSANPEVNNKLNLTG
jgi:hypothetical protein